MGSKQPTFAQCAQALTAPGRPFEIEQKVINGLTVDVYKHLPKTFRDFHLAAYAKYSDRVFISSPVGPTRQHFTFAQIHEEALNLAAWMREQGVKVGTRVGIAGGNSPGWVVSWSACHLIGAVPAALNAWLPNDVLEHCLSIVKPALLLVDGERAERLGPLATQLKEQGTGPIVCWEPKQYMPPSTRGIVPCFEDVVRPSKASIESVKKGEGLDGLEPDSDGVIFFSSGTSGSPKAVLSSQRAAISGNFSGLYALAVTAARAGITIDPNGPQKVFLLSIPLFHVTGNLSTLSRAYHAGLKLVFSARWNVKEAIQLIKSEGVTHLGGVPAIVEGLLQDKDMGANSTIESVLYGGAPASHGLPKEVKASWTNAVVAQGYGLTETNAAVCVVTGQDYLDNPESVGPPSPVAKFKIVDVDTKKELPVGQIGLILIYGVQVMKRYENNEAATREALKDGWFNSGDIGCLDENGFLYIKDRLKDIIIRGGENITSSDVENALYDHPSVGEVAAIGVPDKVLGEKVGAIVHLRPGHEGKVTEVELIESVRKTLPRHSVPSIVMISPDPLLRNVNGKLMKKELKPVLAEVWNKRGRLDAGKVRSKL